MALIVHTRAGTPWTGPLASDPILLERFPPSNGAYHPTVARFHETGDASELGDLGGVTRYTVVSLDPRELDECRRDGRRVRPPVRPDDENTNVVICGEIARRGLLWIDALPEVKPAVEADGVSRFPAEHIARLAPYTLMVSEMATRIQQLGQLGKAPASPSNSPSGATPSSETAPAREHTSTATAATDAAPNPPIATTKDA